MELDKKSIELAINKAQHCQRNWDLSKQIPKEDLDLMVHAVTQCPSKQNVAFYKVFVITDREVIEGIHANTTGFTLMNDAFDEMKGDEKVVTNSQTLANVLFVFTSNVDNSDGVRIKREYHNENDHTFERDLQQSVGVAAGMVSLTSTLLGYKTGYCACFDNEEIKNILVTDDDVVLMMGIGYKSDINRRKHHKDHSVIFPSIKKEKIPVTYI